LLIVQRTKTQLPAASKDFRTCRGHIQPGGNNNGKKRSATETTALEVLDSFLNGNSSEACGGVDEEEKGNELERDSSEGYNVRCTVYNEYLSK
jgi:hypothetical protein